MKGWFMKKNKLMLLSLVVLSTISLSANARSERDFSFPSRQVVQSKEEQKSPSVESTLTQEKSSCDSKPCGECC
jgi:hypothetical protein